MAVVLVLVMVEGGMLGEAAVERVDVEGVAVEVVEVINRVCLCGLSTETLSVHCGRWSCNL